MARPATAGAGHTSGNSGTNSSFINDLLYGPLPAKLQPQTQEQHRQRPSSMQQPGKQQPQQPQLQGLLSTRMPTDAAGPSPTTEAVTPTEYPSSRRLMGARGRGGNPGGVGGVGGQEDQEKALSKLGLVLQPAKTKVATRQETGTGGGGRKPSMNSSQGDALDTIIIDRKANRSRRAEHSADSTSTPRKEMGSKEKAFLRNAERAAELGLSLPEEELQMSGPPTARAVDKRPDGALDLLDELLQTKKAEPDRPNRVVSLNATDTALPATSSGGKGKLSVRSVVSGGAGSQSSLTAHNPPTTTGTTTPRSQEQTRQTTSPVKEASPPTMSTLRSDPSPGNSPANASGPAPSSLLSFLASSGPTTTSSELSTAPVHISVPSPIHDSANASAAPRAAADNVTAELPAGRSAASSSSHYASISSASSSTDTETAFNGSFGNSVDGLPPSTKQQPTDPLASLLGGLSSASSSSTRKPPLSKTTGAVPNATPVIAPATSAFSNLNVTAGPSQVAANSPNPQTTISSSGAAMPSAVSSCHVAAMAGVMAGRGADGVAAQMTDDESTSAILSKRLTAERQQWQQEKQRLLAEHEKLQSEISSMIIHKNSELIRLEGSHRQAVESMETRWQSEREEMEQRHWGDIDRLQTQHRATLQQLHDANSTHLSQIQQQHQAQILHLKTQFSSEVKLQQVVNTFTASADHLEQMRLKIDTEAEEKRITQESETREKDRRQEEAYRCLKAEHVAAVQSQSQLQQLIGQLQTELKHHRDHQQYLADSMAEDKQRLLQAEETHRMQESKHAQAYTDLQQSLQRERSKQETRLQQLESSIKQREFELGCAQQKLQAEKEEMRCSQERIDQMSATAKERTRQHEAVIEADRKRLREEQNIFLDQQVQLKLGKERTEAERNQLQQQLRSLELEAASVTVKFAETQALHKETERLHDKTMEANLQNQLLANQNTRKSLTASQAIEDLRELRRTVEQEKLDLFNCSLQHMTKSIGSLPSFHKVPSFRNTELNPASDMPQPTTCSYNLQPHCPKSHQAHISTLSSSLAAPRPASCHSSLQRQVTALGAEPASSLHATASDCCTLRSQSANDHSYSQQMLTAVTAPTCMHAGRTVAQQASSWVPRYLTERQQHHQQPCMQQQTSHNSCRDFSVAPGARLSQSTTSPVTSRNPISSHIAFCGSQTSRVSHDTCS
eukprot:GHVQ01026845.1.p2 GENE.GHVQ01026845.1~~GHVQ01026845.1.p2  ORF type:complete len:1188 (-),score=235.55 GHVQ01026845.1:6480-10043(-)